jgi:4-amino-4-deoxy-L-arabinose transferase-like glycosyltransferase
VSLSGGDGTGPAGPRASPDPVRRRRDLALLAGVLALGLLPFAGKPFHIDDPLFVWTAQQIRAEPLDPYGFELNWYMSPKPMWRIMQNPPLAAYYLAGVSAAAGASEAVLHLALFVPALLLVWGTYLLACRFSAPPLLAAAIAAASPVAAVSATTVMCDVPMLALWVWAVYFWDRGIGEDDARFLAAAALAAGAAALTKYFGMALIPLLAVDALIRRPRAGRALAFLAVPLGLLVAYQWATATVYGRGLLLHATAYATERQAATLGAHSARLTTGLAFTGGSAAAVACLAPLLLAPRRLALAVAAVAALAALFSFDPVVAGFLLEEARTPWVVAQLALWSVTGAAILALAAVEVRRRPGPQSVLLALWIGGTFVFAAAVNWTVNGRSILPLVPAVGILAARRIGDGARRRPWVAGPGLALAACIALAATWADFGLARSARTAAEVLVRESLAQAGAPWFQGHWGFQYYAEKEGARALNLMQPQMQRGELVLLPEGNTNVVELPAEVAHLAGALDFPVPRWVATMAHSSGAGFYSTLWGPLPFSFGPVPPQRYRIYVARGWPPAASGSGAREGPASGASPLPGS